MKLALFDFDGTITKSDTLPDFIQFACGKARYYWGLLLLSPILLGYVLKLVPNNIAKEKMLGHFFRGWSEKKFLNIATDYATTQVDQQVRKKAAERIDWHLSEGHRVVIVSASLEDWIKPWCERNRIELLATQFEKQSGTLTGHFSSKNCYGPEKVNRIKQSLDLESFDYIYAYGDSRGDKEMLALANESLYRPF